MPIDILLCEFHYLVLYGDSLTVMSRINEKSVAKYDLSFLGEATGMRYESFSKVTWIFSSKGVCKLLLKDD